MNHRDVPRPSIALKYVDQVYKFYDALYRSGISADVVSVEADKLGRYVEAGGHSSQLSLAVLSTNPI